MDRLANTRTPVPRGGFTLVEVIIVLAAVAVLSVFVYPVVKQRIGEAGPVRASAELVSIRRAMELFHLNTGLAYPSSLDHLVDPITTADQDITGEFYTQRQVNSWKGPYIERVPSSLLGQDAFSIGGGELNTVLRLYDSSTGAIVSDASLADWIAIEITGLIGEEFEKVNDLIDGTDEPDGEAEGGSWVTGELRFSTDDQLDPGIGDGTTYYLAVPIHVR